MRSNIKQQEKKKRNRGATQRKKTNQQQTPTLTVEQNNKPQTPVKAIERTPITTTSIVLSSNHSQTNNNPKVTDEPDIMYDNRVIEQNTNKKDHCHGFTLITIPYIIKNGVHSFWTNQQTGHQDDLFVMYGEIEYKKNDIPT